MKVYVRCIHLLRMLHLFIYFAWFIHSSALKAVFFVLFACFIHSFSSHASLFICFTFFVHLFASHASFIHPLWTYPSACAPFIHLVRHLEIFVGAPVPGVTHDEKTSNLKLPSLTWHMIIQMRLTKRGRKVVMWDDGSRKLMMKVVQESLRDGDRWSNSTVTVCKVWLSWEAKLHKF